MYECLIFIKLDYWANSFPGSDVMSTIDACKVGKRGMVVLPSKLRKRLGIEEGTYVIAEERDDGILLRPAVITPVETYTPERVAEFLLGSALDAESYAKALTEVRKMGLDPAKIDHFKPPGV
jgi:AbrB family looped-hinge helix DNA binding protein